MRRVSDPSILKDELKWCFEAAEHNHSYSQRVLGHFYHEGVGVTKDNEKSYFWYKLGGNPTGTVREVAKKLSQEQLDKLDKSVNQWKPKQPEAKSGVGSGIDFAARYNPTMPINVSGLLCGGRAKRCNLDLKCSGAALVIYLKLIVEGF